MDANSAPSAPASAAEDLLNYAIDRQDIKWCLARLPARQADRLARIDVELQMLKIIGVGWSLNHRLTRNPFKAVLQEAYWKEVRDFSGRFGATTDLLIGRPIDYFRTLEDRLNLYVAAMNDADPASGADPGRIIGAALARLCDCGDDLPVLMAAARIFNSTRTRVDRYLTAAGFDE